MPTQTFINLPHEKKEKILNAAKKEFSRVSLSEASINNIILEAKISRGSFYQYFEDKKDLLEYIQKSTKEDLQKTCKAKIDENGDIFEMYITFYDKIINIIKNNKNCRFYKMVLANLRANDGMIFVQDNSKSELFNYILKHTDTSQFKNKDDLATVINMLNAITRWSIIQTVLLNSNSTDLREDFIKQINYLKDGILRKEKKC